MILTPPLLDAHTPQVQIRALEPVESLLAFFDSALVRLLAFAVVTPLLWASLGETRFGIVALMAAVAGLLDWPLRAIGVTATRTLLVAVRVDDLIRVRRVMFTGWLLLAGGGLVMTLGLVLGRMALLDAVGIEPELRDEAADYVVLTGLRLAAAAAMGVWQSAVLAAGLGGELRVIRGIRTMLEVIVAFTIASADYTLQAVGVLELAVVGAWGLAMLRVLHRAGPAWQPSLEDLDAQTARSLVTHGAVEASQSTSFLLTLDIGVLVVALVNNVGLAGLLAVVAQGARLLAGVALQLGAFIFDRFADLSIATPKVERRWLYRRAMDASAMTVGGLAVVWTVVGERALAAWLDVPPMAHGAGAVALLVTVSALSVVSVRFLVRVGLDVDLGPTAAGEAVLATILSLGAVGRWGLPGVVMGVVVAHLATIGWRAPWLICRQLGIRLDHFVRARVLRLALCTVPAIATGLALSSLRAVRTGKDLAVVAVICAILHAVSAFATWYLLGQRLGVEND